jgi:hypothetical protein
MNVLFGRANKIRKMEVKFPLPSTKTGGFLFVSKERPGLRKVDSTLFYVLALGPYVI